MDELEKILNERGKAYGKFDQQAKCVGQIIIALQDVAYEQDKEPSAEVTGCFAYIATKLARIAYNENHSDSLDDLINYAQLTRKLLRKNNESTDS